MSSQRQPKYELYDLIYREADHGMKHYGVYIGSWHENSYWTEDEHRSGKCVYHLAGKSSSSGTKFELGVTSLDDFETRGDGETKSRSKRDTNVKKDEPQNIKKRIEELDKSCKKGELEYKLIRIFGRKKAHEWNCEEFARYIVTGKKESKQAQDNLGQIANVLTGVLFVGFLGGFMLIHESVRKE